ncbi:methionine/alanine import family NSS transporter small subunit [Janibacter indicus]|uniref:Putative methionine and alanine importer, small subunit n=1 Tax=Janibacter indicus TaxID=857417 RepID=A0A1W1Y5C4_9MICO|nr:methionine/alanine import family NSS transporter small subunit [Janibacter indicus]SMC31344.1 Putative methionine and alanine importer, small subunit [Janibacter indicus]
MTTTAIIMLIVATLVIWGGLALAIANLATRGDSASADVTEFEVHRDL